ncbi:MAG TPA: hypothetical protein VN836_02695 [Verrucomicrobiae bacterium]|nr:hypothetical protein [Verrucomicrobiae bacterium]
MNDQTKGAYRHLLYVAMLATRNYCQPRADVSLNPLTWRRQYLQSRKAGMLADWLHNFAMFSSLNFEGFREDLFGKEHQSICQNNPDSGFERYLEIFDEYMKGNDFFVERTLLCHEV